MPEDWTNSVPQAMTVEPDLDAVQRRDTVSPGALESMKKRVGEDCGRDFV